MTQLSAQTCLKVPNNTRFAFHDDDLVLSGVTGTKTISGEHVCHAKSLLEAVDGETELGEIADGMGSTTAAVAEALCEEGVLYPAALLDPLGLDEQYVSLFESILLSLPRSERESFAADITSTTVRVRGDGTLVDEVGPKLRSIGWEVDTAGAPTDSDVILYLETDPGERAPVNREWLASTAVLVRIALDGDSIEVGPILTPSANACLDCLTRREEMNDVASDLGYQPLNPARTHGMGIVENVTLRLTAQAAAAALPPSFEGTIKTLRLSTLEYRESHLLAVPGCEGCGT